MSDEPPFDASAVADRIQANPGVGRAVGRGSDAAWQESAERRAEGRRQYLLDREASEAEQVKADEHAHAEQQAAARQRQAERDEARATVDRIRRSL